MNSRLCYPAQEPRLASRVRGRSYSPYLDTNLTVLYPRFSLPTLFQKSMIVAVRVTSVKVNTDACFIAEPIATFLDPVSHVSNHGVDRSRPEKSNLKLHSTPYNRATMHV